MFCLFKKLNSNDGNNKKLKSFASVTLSSRDLQILETMVRSKNIDYMEIDRILNGMFAPVKQSHFGFQESNSFVDTYQVIQILLEQSSINIGNLLLILVNYQVIVQVY